MHSLNNNNKTANYQEGTSWNGESWPTPAPQGDMTTWNYDAATGLVTSKIYADGHGPSYAYTANGKLASRTWARKDAQNNDLVTTYSYNLFGELTGLDYSDSTPDITYSYNRVGKLDQVTDVVGTRTFAYNATLDEVSETITGLYGKTLTRAYTATGFKGRKQGLSIDNVLHYTYGYDTYGRMNQITIPSGSFGYTRLANSDLVSQMTRPNGITTTWSYETNRDLITQVQNGTVSAYGYVNDAIGRRTSMSRSGSAYANPDTISYAYNDRSELTGAQSNVDTTYSYSYAYDPIGNRTTANEAGVPWTYTTNNLNQYTSATENNTQLSFAYDLDGSMTYRPVDANSGWTQVWNGENRMVETYKGSDRLTFKYDYMGRRVEKCVYSGNTLTSKTLFVYDGFKCIEELDALDANAILMHHAWQPFDVGLDVILATTDTNGSSYFLHDANKNVMQKNNAIGDLLNKFAYTLFGKNIGNVLTQYGFSSECIDSETEMVYFNYRHYTSNIGRWCRRDPIGEVNIISLYSFVMNNTSNLFDLLGLECCGNVELSPNQCCINDVPQEKIYDDAGEQCCPNEIVTIELRNENFIPILNSGHSFIWIPPRNGKDNGVGYGFYPAVWWKIFNGNGIIMSDDYDHPYTEKLTYYYDSCPNSVNKLIQNIIDDMKKTYLYRADGSSRDDVYNCSQMACKWLKDSGFRPPFNPNEKIMPSPIPFGKGGYDPHPKRRIIRE